MRAVYWIHSIFIQLSFRRNTLWIMHLKMSLS